MPARRSPARRGPGVLPPRGGWRPVPGLPGPDAVRGGGRRRGRRVPARTRSCRRSRATRAERDRIGREIWSRPLGDTGLPLRAAHAAQSLGFLRPVRRQPGRLACAPQAPGCGCAQPTRRCCSPRAAGCGCARRTARSRSAGRASRPSRRDRRLSAASAVRAAGSDCGQPAVFTIEAAAYVEVVPQLALVLRRPGPARPRATRMCPSQASCAARSTGNGACRIRSRGWPRLSLYVRGPPQYWIRNSVSRSSAGPEVLLRVHRPQQRVLGDALVEAVHQAPEGLLAADLLVEGLLLKRAARNLFHASMVSDAAAEDSRFRTVRPGHGLRTRHVVRGTHSGAWAPRQWNGRPAAAGLAARAALVRRDRRRAAASPRPGLAGGLRGGAAPSLRAVLLRRRQPGRLRAAVGRGPRPAAPRSAGCAARTRTRRSPPGCGTASWSPPAASRR